MELLLTLVVGAFFLCLATAVLRSSQQKQQQQRTVEIGDPAVAHRALIGNADSFSNRPAALFPVALVTGCRRRRSDGLTSVPYGPRWRALRCNLTAETLHPSRLADSLAPLQREAVEALVAGMPATAGQAVVRDGLHAAVFGLVARLCFGDGVAADARADAVQRIMRDFVRAVGEAKVFATGSRLARIVYWRRRRRFLGFRGRQAELFFPIIAEARRRSSSDGSTRASPSYVDSLLGLRVPDDKYEDDDLIPGTDVQRRPLTDDEMVSLVSEFLAAGTETVVACVEWALAHLVARPDVQTKLRRELDEVSGCGGPYLRAVVLESLRMHPPVPFLMRETQGAAAAAVVGTAGDSLRVHFLSREIGRDGKTWTDPDEFRPERFLPGGEAEDVGPLPGPREIRMLPFGAGRRYCPGMGLGMLNVKCFLSALVREFEWSAPSAAAVDLTELDGFFKTMKKPLSAVVTRRDHLKPAKTILSNSRYGYSLSTPLELFG